MKFKPNKLQVELLLNVGRFTVTYYLFWETYWLLMYDLLLWKKPFILVLYLDKLMIIVFCLIGLAILETLIAHPELLVPKKPKRRVRQTAQKAEEKKKKTDKEMPMY